MVSLTEGGTHIGFFENRVLRKIFGPKRDEVIRECRRLHNKELYDLYSSPNIIWVMKSRRMRWMEHIAHMEDRRGANGIWWKTLKDREPLGKPTAIWEDNIKVDLLAHTHHWHDSRTTKWKKLNTEEPNRFIACGINLGLHR